MAISLAIIALIILLIIALYFGGRFWINYQAQASAVDRTCMELEQWGSDDFSNDSIRLTIKKFKTADDLSSASENQKQVIACYKKQLGR